MKTFFTSDTHFGHANIIRYAKRPQLRPGDEVTVGKETMWFSKKVASERATEMDKFLIDRHNSVVTDTDDIYHNGDFCFGTGQDALNYLNRLNFYRFYFIWGNHDKAMQDVWKIKTGPVCAEQTKYADLLNRLYFIGNMKEVTFGDKSIILNHYAMRVWNRSHHGAWHLYGHSHGSLPDDPHSRSFDVGVDCHDYYPITLEQVGKIMDKKLWKPIDHHGESQEGGGKGLGKEDYDKLERKRQFEQLKREFEP